MGNHQLKKWEKEKQEKKNTKKSYRKSEFLFIMIPYIVRE